MHQTSLGYRDVLEAETKISAIDSSSLTLLSHGGRYHSGIDFGILVVILVLRLSEWKFPEETSVLGGT